eukprot:1004556-Rhodomonas_salina.1
MDPIHSEAAHRKTAMEDDTQCAHTTPYVLDRKIFTWQAKANLMSEQAIDKADCKSANSTLPR